MKTRMMTATAVAMMLCAPAFAQTTTTTDAANSSAMSSAMPQGWNDELGTAFFSDSALGTLRTDDEISANWEGLSDEQKAQVTGYCDTMDTASASGTTMAPGGAASGTATTGAAGTTTGAGDTASTTTSPSIEGDSTPNATADSATGTAGASGGVSTDTTASTSQDGTSATGGMDAGASVNMASMQRLCDVVGELD